MKWKVMCALMVGALSMGTISAESGYTHRGPVYEVPSKVKVLIRERSEGALLEARGAFRVVDAANGDLLASGLKGRRFYLHTIKDGFRWGEAFRGIYQIEVVPASPDASILVDGIQYSGSIAIYQVNGLIHVVNHVSMQDLLKSVLASEFSASKYEPQAMEALAVCARTRFLHALSKTRNKYWDFDAKEIGYVGSAASLTAPAIERAVDKTVGEVLTHRSHLFPAMWTGHSGGITTRYETIYRKNEPCTEGIEVPLARQTREATRWNFDISKEDLAILLKSEKIDGVDLYAEPVSHRVYALRFKKGNEQEVMTFLDFQKLVGIERIASNDFVCRANDDTFSFQGWGRGAGVGLCLYASNEMAKKGDQHETILSYFFPGACVQSQAHGARV